MKSRWHDQVEHNKANKETIKGLLIAFLTRTEVLSVGELVAILENIKKHCDGIRCAEVCRGCREGPANPHCSQQTELERALDELPAGTPWIARAEMTAESKITPDVVAWNALFAGAAIEAALMRVDDC